MNHNEVPPHPELGGENGKTTLLALFRFNWPIFRISPLATL
jgi:hypothetical protein